MILSRLLLATCVSAALAGAALAQDHAPPAAPPAPDLGPKFPAEVVERGRVMLSAQCGFCHGTTGRGGSGGPDLTLSPLVQEDVDGKQIAEFIRVGRPDRGMPAFNLPEAQVKDIATFLHAQIFLNVNKRLATISTALVGDPARGKTYFEGAGGCAKCHSATGDLKGIGGKYAPPALQDRIAMPRASVSFGPRPKGDPWESPNAMQGTVADPSGPVTGRIIRLSDFSVTLFFPDTRRTRTWNREDGKPAVTVTDPMKAHVDHLAKWTDGALHDVTAYLASLK